MKILALEKELPGATDDQIHQHAKAEAHRAWELHQQGIIRELYFRQDRSEAVLMLECKDVSAAEAVLQTLPLVEAGLITFELIPLVAYPGFSRLFTTS
jgi:muconolactone delta-isomerase